MDYLPQKAKKITPEERLQKQLDFEEKMKLLKNAPVEMNSDLSEKIIKDLPVERIDSKSSIPVNTGESIAKTFGKIAERRAARAVGQGRTQSSGIPGDVLDYNQLRKEYKLKQQQEKNSRLAKALKKSGKVAATLVPGLGVAGALMAGSADEALANAVIPGGIEGVGAGSDLPMEDDTAQIQTYAESATDPNLRRMALQELRNRGR
jgi:hypothetical protein